MLHCKLMLVNMIERYAQGVCTLARILRAGHPLGSLVTRTVRLTVMVLLPNLKTGVALGR